MGKKQSLKERYKRARKNLMKRIETANRYGVSIPESAIPSIPKRITSSSINFLNSLKGEKLYRLSPSYRVQGLTVGQIKGQIVRQQTEQRKLTQEIKQEFQISTQEYKRNMEYYQEALRQGLNAETLEFYRRNATDFGRDKQEYSDTVLSKALRILNSFNPFSFNTKSQYLYHKVFRDNLLGFFESFTSTPYLKSKLTIALEEIGGDYIEAMLNRILYESGDRRATDYLPADLTDKLINDITLKMNGVDRPKVQLWKDPESIEDFMKRTERGKMSEEEAMEWIKGFGHGVEYNKAWVRAYMDGTLGDNKNKKKYISNKTYFYNGEIYGEDWGDEDE